VWLRLQRRRGGIHLLSKNVFQIVSPECCDWPAGLLMDRGDSPCIGQSGQGRNERIVRGIVSLASYSRLAIQTPAWLDWAGRTGGERRRGKKIEMPVSR
jgi:hypothetical protein